MNDLSKLLCDCTQVSNRSTSCNIRLISCNVSRTHAKFKNISEKIKPIFYTKGQGGSAITISENDCLISDPQAVAEILNTHFVSIGQTKNSIHKGLTENSTITEIIRYFEEHSRIKTINKFLTNNSTLSFKPITKESLRQIIVKLSQKGTRARHNKCKIPKDLS